MINIKKYLEEIISEYHDLNTRLEEGVRAANQGYQAKSLEKTYTPEYLQNSLYKAVNQAMEEHLTNAAELNRKVRQHITATREKLSADLAVKNKPDDYSVRINNALAFLQIEGPEITDATAAQILKDFLGDVEIMQRFRSVIERQKGDKLSDAYGKTTFPLTFGQLEKCEMLMDAVAELENMAEHLFIRKKAETEVEHFKNGVKLYVPMDGYSQQVGELSILEQAGTVETMAAELTGAKN